jgi:acyl-coenzyme A thioesterase PaaI-like protein
MGGGAGVLGGGGTKALNGEVIAAVFDAAFVLAGLAQYEAEVVVTLELSVQFLSLATIDRPRALTAVSFALHVASATCARPRASGQFVESRVRYCHGHGRPGKVCILR